MAHVEGIGEVRVEVTGDKAYRLLVNNQLRGQLMRQPNGVFNIKFDNHIIGQARFNGADGKGYEWVIVDKPDIRGFLPDVIGILLSRQPAYSGQRRTYFAVYQISRTDDFKAEYQLLNFFSKRESAEIWRAGYIAAKPRVSWFAAGAEEPQIESDYDRAVIIVTSSGVPGEVYVTSEEEEALHV